MCRSAYRLLLVILSTQIYTQSWTVSRTHADQPSSTSAAAQSARKHASPQSTTGYISVANALIYSGPSEDFYPTSQLKQGSAIEYFHQTESGWSAIRPPSGSFSWIPATDAYLLPGGKAIEITSHSCVSWIGSSLGTAAQYRWQVQLNVGEQLIRLGEESIKDKEGNERLWYKIAPPDGEFRWIRSSAISHEPPVAQVSRKQAASNAVVPAGANDKSNERSVVAVANHSVMQEPVEGLVIEGQADDDQFVQGDYYDGQIMDGEIVNDGAIYDGEFIDGQYLVEEEVLPEHDANWNDWQLFEFTDQGLRFPFLERTAAWRNKQRDPLAADPFSLEMAPKKRGQIPPGLPELEPALPNRRHTPWRDPRRLSQQRMMGYPQTSGQVGQGGLSAIQDSLQRTRENLGRMRDGAIGGTMGTVDSAWSNSGTVNSGAPRSAPPIDLQASQFPNFGDQGPLQPNTQATGSGIGTGTGLGDNIGTMGANGSMGQVDMPNLPSMSHENAQGGNGYFGGQRGWLGFGQNSGVGLGLQPMMESSSHAVYQLQQRLSEMVTRPMTQWSFGDLKERVQYFIHHGNSAVERGQARLLMERIGEYERHAMRSSGWLSGNSYSDQFNTSPIGSSTIHAPVVTAGFTSSASNANSNNVSVGNYDATGWLVPVHAAQPGKPAYALTSDTGQIVTYITALPGMNIERYVNQAVGVHGLRGYLAEFQAPHVEAQNISRLR